MPVLDESRAETTEAEDFVYVDIDQQYDDDLESSFHFKEKSCRRSSFRAASHPKQIPVPIIQKTVAVEANDTHRMASSNIDVSASSPTGSDSNNMCYLHSCEAYPKKELETDDPNLEIPFTPICGEAVQYLGATQEGILALSSYRIFHRSAHGIVTNIPLMLVENAEIRDIFYLHIFCKDARSLRCLFVNGEKCMEWQRRIATAILPPDSLDKYFAFFYKAWANERGGEEVLRRLTAFPLTDRNTSFHNEFSRLEFNKTWRISKVNQEFSLCPSYPHLLIVPNSIGDETLELVAKFRSSRRIPAVVWRHKGNGAVIARCSQPEVGWLGWRSNEDENLLAALASSACQNKDSKISSTSPRKLLIIDARSYASAVTNRARGGGYECSQYYPGAEIQFMCLPNIHSVRKSFQALRALAAESPDHANWHSVLEKSLWLQAVAGLLKAACIVARSVHMYGRPTLVHCSDGWDRTPQIVSTAELLLDPYYRTCEGFKILVEREWLDFGHKFADRCGHTVGVEDLNERCPVFLQWLDCVHQLILQYPCSFEFSQTYLIKLAQHAYSCLFGTFLCNNLKERKHRHVDERTFSVWNFLRGPSILNHLYEPNKEVLYPAHSSRSLVVWAAVYLGVAPDTPATAQPPSSPPPPAHSTSFNGSPTNGTMTKTRSYQDLSTLNEYNNSTLRRSSDPNIAIDPMKTSTLSLSGTICNDNNSKNIEPNLISGISDEDISSDKTIEDSKSSLVKSADLSINATVPKQMVKGYSCTDNGNNVPTSSTYDLDFSNVMDSNYNNRSPTFNLSANLYDNGNMLTQVKSNSEMFDQTDDCKKMIDVSGSYEESSQIFHIVEDSQNKMPFNVCNSPMDDFSLSYNSVAESGIGRRNRIESFRWSESECSQHTDSSCVDLAGDIPLEIGLRDKNDDSVQNGVLDATNANLLAAEVGTTFETPIDIPSPEKRMETDDSFQHFSLPSEMSDLTLCPNSPLKSIQGSSASPVNVHLSSTNDTNLQSSEAWSESCCLTRLHHYDSHGCNATHLQCLLHCYTHCTHSNESSGNSNNTSSLVTALDPVDGLVFPQSPVQHRLHQIIQDHKMKEEALRKELHAARVELQQRAARASKSNPESSFKDNLEGDVVSNETVDPFVSKNFSDYNNDLRDDNIFPSIDTDSEHVGYDSAFGSIDGGTFGNATGSYNSKRTESSNFNNRSGNNGDTTLWVPDHAVRSCTRCGGSFWLGKRKHHCRHCGKIFCASCSEKTSPLPKEQLFNPVRVCLECHEALSSDSRSSVSEQSGSSRSTQIGINTKQMPVNSSAHVSSAEVRPLSDFCKQVSGDQNLNSSPVTAASN